MRKSKREGIFANEFSFADIVDDPSAVIGTAERVWYVGDYAFLLNKLIDFLDLVLVTGKLAFRIVRNGDGTIIKVRSEKLANCFQPWFRQLIDVCLPRTVFSEDIELFRNCYLADPAIRSCLFESRNRGLVGNMTEADAFNTFVDRLRVEAKRQRVKRKLESRARSLTKRQDKLIRAYLATLPFRTTKILAIRAELQYREVAVCPNDVLVREFVEGLHDGLPAPIGLEVRPECRARFDAERAMWHRDRFVANRHGKDCDLFEHLIGYLWKIEQSEGVIHHHVVFFFDRQHVQDEFYWLERIFHRWEVITEGGGYGSSPHYRKESFEEKGLWHYGDIDCHDPRAVKRMVEDVVGYFAKAGQFLKGKPTRDARTLTKGQKYRPRMGGPGRPRKQLPPSAAPLDASSKGVLP